MINIVHGVPKGGSGQPALAIDVNTGRMYYSGGPVTGWTEISASADAGGVPASPNGSIQFNNSGAFGGSSNLVFDPSTFKLTFDASARGFGVDSALTVIGRSPGGGQAARFGLPDDSTINVNFQDFYVGIVKAVSLGTDATFYAYSEAPDGGQTAAAYNGITLNHGISTPSEPAYGSCISIYSDTAGDSLDAIQGQVDVVFGTTPSLNTLRAFHAEAPENLTSVTGLLAGFYSDALGAISGGGVIAAFYAEDQGSSANNYAIYSAGGKSYFAHNTADTGGQALVVEAFSPNDTNYPSALSGFLHEGATTYGSDGVADGVDAISGTGYATNATGTLASIAGYGGRAEMDGAGTVDALIGVRAWGNSKTAGTVNKSIGVLVSPQTVGTTNYGIYITGQGAGYAIYSDGGKSYIKDGLILESAAPTAAASQVSIGGTVATAANAGAHGDVPAQVAGYLVINVAGTTMKVPYYAN